MPKPAIGAVQFEPTVGEVDTNLRQMDELAETLPISVKVAVYPELCVTGYDLDVAQSTAEPVPGGLTDGIVNIAQEHDIHLLAGLPERDGDQLFNSFVYASPDGVHSVYRKQRLWGDEAELFTEGAGTTIINTPIGQVGLLVCYDLNFPELCLRYANSEVDVLAVTSAWRTSFLEDWRLLLRARALDGTCYAVGANHLGDQRGRWHAGHSLIAGPTGTILDEAGDDPGFAVGAVDQTQLVEARERNPVHRDRKVFANGKQSVHRSE